MRILLSGFLMTGLLLIGVSIQERREARQESSSSPFHSSEDGTGFPYPHPTPSPTPAQLAP
jgi:hypothetical protein